MDVEQMMKVNLLSKELKKHGFAISSQDAFKQAESAYGHVFEHSALAHQAQLLEPAEAKSEPGAPATHFSAPAQELRTESDHFLLNKKIEILIKKNSVQLERQMEALKEMVTALASELELLRKAVNRKEEAPKTYVFESPKEHKEPQETLQKHTEQTAFHPKQGNYQTSDVSVEKMFYFGKK